MSGRTPLESITASRLCCGRASWMCHEIKALGIRVFRSKAIKKHPCLGQRIKGPLHKRGVHAFADVTLEHRYDEGTTRCRGKVFGVLRVQIGQLRRSNKVNPEVLGVKIVKRLKHKFRTLLRHAGPQSTPHDVRRQGRLLPPKGRFCLEAMLPKVAPCQHVERSCVLALLQHPLCDKQEGRSTRILNPRQCL
jgi:hypothetical protein